MVYDLDSPPLSSSAFQSLGDASDGRVGRGPGRAARDANSEGHDHRNAVPVDLGGLHSFPLWRAGAERDEKHDGVQRSGGNAPPQVL